MGASYADREGGTSTTEAPEGQQQQAQQEQQPASQQMFQVSSTFISCCEYWEYWSNTGGQNTASTGSMWAVLLKANYGEDSEYTQSIEPGTTAAYSSEILSE